MKMVEKATRAERANHWVLMLSFFVLMLTGFGFAFNSLSWLNTVFGGSHIASAIHEWVGVVFLLSLLYSILNYLGESLRWSREDSDWVKRLGGYFSREETPPQGRLNAGQKLFYLCVLVFGLAVSASGLLIWLAGGQRGWVQLGHLVHNIAFVVFVIAVPLHAYLATAANPGTFRVMTRGTVPLEWAKKHHGKWVREAHLE
jgi:formate dehydrogenase subunit gamma